MHMLDNCFTKFMFFRISWHDVERTDWCTTSHIQLTDGSTAGNLSFYFVYHKNTFKKPNICKNVSDFCYAYFEVLWCTLNWSRLHNFIHDILLWAKTVWRSNTVEVSTKNCLWMGWRFAASCKKVRALGQSTPFQKPISCRVWIARFIHHTATVSGTKCHRNKFSCKKELRQHCKTTKFQN